MTQEPQDELEQMHERELCDVFMTEVCGWEHRFFTGSPKGPYWIHDGHTVSMILPAIRLEDAMPWLEQYPGFDLYKIKSEYVAVVDYEPLLGASAVSKISLAHAVCLALIRAKRGEKK